MNVKKLFDLCKQAVSAWSDDYAPSMGAAISYYTIFSLAPLLVIVIAIAGAIFGREAAQGEIVAQISGMVGADGAAAVESMLKAVDEPGKGLIAGGISVVILMIGATTVFAELQSALDRIWHVPERQKPSGIWALLQARVLSFGLILGLAFLLIVSLVVSAGLAAFGSWFGGLLPGWEILLLLLNTAISIGIMTALFAMIYKLMPTARIAWRDVWVGAFVTAVLFEIGKTAIGLYLGKSGVNESFAAAGSLVVLVAWVYYAAQIFLLGAEFTKVYAGAHGSTSGVKAVAATQAKVEEDKAGTDRVAPGGVPTNAGASVAMQASEAHVAKVDEAHRQLSRRVDRASQTLVRQIVLFAAVTVTSAVVNGLQKRQQRRLRQRPRYR